MDTHCRDGCKTSTLVPDFSCVGVGVGVNTIIK